MNRKLIIIFVLSVLGLGWVILGAIETRAQEGKGVPVIT